VTAETRPRAPDKKAAKPGAAGLMAELAVVGGIPGRPWPPRSTWRSSSSRAVTNAGAPHAFGRAAPPRRQRRLRCRAGGAPAHGVSALLPSKPLRARTSARAPSAPPWERGAWEFELTRSFDLGEAARNRGGHPQPGRRRARSPHRRQPRRASERSSARPPAPTSRRCGASAIASTHESLLGLAPPASSSGRRSSWGRAPLTGRN
jgi:hypothetical protein